ncbi:MAG: Uma2 family endonuclease [Verrucomicrobia bacterium]|nr:Uma2 family endonuclease [Verrucomicrobiota bacterium]
MQVQARHRFTVEEYHRMAETGVLKPDARVELLNGEIIDMSPIGPFHGGVTTYLTEIFVAASKGRWQTRVQNSLWLDAHSEPQPDLVLAKRSPDYYRKRHPRPADVYLLIEVSDSSLGADQADKLAAYGRAGIAEVWIVNLNELTVEVYREPHFTGYGSKVVLRAGDQARPLAFPDVAVDVAELLKR